MSLRTAARLARREMRGGLRGLRLLLLCLAFGVAAIAAVGSVRTAIEAGLAREGATLLGGDAELRFTYRFAAPEERAWMAARALRLSEVAEFRSMAVVARDGRTERALTQVKAVDDAWPLTGRAVLEPDMTVARALAGRDGRPGALMEQSLADRLGLAPGDRFRLGSREFVLAAILRREPDAAASGFTLGPRTIVATAALAGSGLLTPGTLFTTAYRLALPPGADLAALERAAAARFASAGVRWRDSRNGAPGITRFVERLGAFLVLVGLAGLAVGGIGVSAAVRAYLETRTTVIATLRSLGADRATVFRVYFLQIGALSLLGITAGVALGGLIPALFGPLLSERLPVPADFGLHPRPLLEAALYGLLAAFVFTLWPLARTGEVRAATLFRDSAAPRRPLPAPRHLAAMAAGLALLVAAAAGFGGAPRLTLWTAAGILAILATLAAAALLVRAAARRGAVAARGRPALRWALTAIAGPREGTVPVVMSLGLGLSVLAALGQIDGNLRNAISRNLPKVAPSYFFVDIQKDQLPRFRARLESDPAVRQVNTAPMLRGIITRINGRPAREVAGEHWVVTGDRGVTYAATPPPGTRLTAGQWWPENYDGPPQVSFAAEEAEEIGLKLGDRITVNILGRDITATVTSFREVDFSTAGIGFVLTMNPAAVAGAPHGFIATVHADEAAEAAILRDLAGMFPNITAIRVRDVIGRVSALLSGLAAATSWGAATTLLSGFLVLIGAAAAGAGARTREAAILKTLGAGRGRILLSFALRSALLGAAAGIVALGAGIAAGGAITTRIMHADFEVIWPSAAGIVAGGALISLLTGLAFARAPLRARPARILRARE